MPLCLCKDSERRVSHILLKSDQVLVAHNSYTTEHILHYLRFPTLLGSQDALPKSSGGSHTVASCSRTRFCLYRNLHLNLWKRKFDGSNFSSSPVYLLGNHLKTYQVVFSPSFSQFFIFLPLSVLYDKQINK